MLAESYERIHRSNLVGMGVIPLEYLPGVTAETLGLTGRERYSVVVPELLEPRMLVDVKVRRRHRFGRGQNSCATHRRGGKCVVEFQVTF